MFDATGSIASTLQLVLDSITKPESESWYEGITGNSVKLLLGASSLCFDFIFIYQHFILYREDKQDTKDLEGLEGEPNERQPLLSDTRC